MPKPNASPRRFPRRVEVEPSLRSCRPHATHHTLRVRTESLCRRALPARQVPYLHSEPLCQERMFTGKTKWRQSEIQQTSFCWCFHTPHHSRNTCILSVFCFSTSLQCMYMHDQVPNRHEVEVLGRHQRINNTSTTNKQTLLGCLFVCWLC